MVDSMVVICACAFAFAFASNVHYLIRYAWLNATLPVERWVPLVPRFPATQRVKWGAPTGFRWGDELLMLQSYTSNIKAYAELSALINKEYCDTKGYRFRAIVAGERSPLERERSPLERERSPLERERERSPLERERERSPMERERSPLERERSPLDRVQAQVQAQAQERSPCWDKVRHIRSLMDDNRWIFWIDSDAVVDRANFGKWIESIAASADAADIYICTSIYLTKNVNTGAMLVRSTPWSRQFFDKWWSWPNARWHRTMCHEQSALDEMISRDVDGILSGRKIALFGCTEFNSTYQHGLRVRGKFIQHYRGCSQDKRIRAFKECLNNKNIV